MQLKIVEKGSWHPDYPINPQCDGYAVGEDGIKYRFVKNLQEQYIREDKEYRNIDEMRSALRYGVIVVGDGVIEFTPSKREEA